MSVLRWRCFQCRITKRKRGVRWRGREWIAKPSRLLRILVQGSGLGAFLRNRPNDSEPDWCWQIAPKPSCALWRGGCWPLLPACVLRLPQTTEPSKPRRPVTRTRRCHSPGHKAKPRGDIRLRQIPVVYRPFDHTGGFRCCSVSTRQTKSADGQRALSGFQ
jgi:hypothetical protein